MENIMLAHNKKLKKLHSKAKWIDKGESHLVMDMRYKSSQEYLKAFAGHIQDSLKGKEKEFNSLVEVLSK